MQLAKEGGPWFTKSCRQCLRRKLFLRAKDDNENVTFRDTGYDRDMFLLISSLVGNTFIRNVILLVRTTYIPKTRFSQIS